VAGDDYDLVERLDAEAPRDPTHATDPKLPAAKEYLKKRFFSPGTRRVYYQRQLQVLAERDYFHWITAAAVKVLVGEGAVRSSVEPLGGSVVRLLWPNGYRFRARETKSLLSLLAEISDPSFATGVGRHGETLFDAAVPRIGMRPIARDVRSHRGKEWTRTGHNLDRIYELDGVEYGVEIKNQLQYIGVEEFNVKLEMCETLGLRPLFIMRALPKSYAWDVIRRGGYALVFGYQMYPHGFEGLAREVKRVLELPVDCPRAIYDNTLQRFLDWHQKTLKNAQGK
jgi:hypothetical protein